MELKIMKKSTKTPSQDVTTKISLLESQLARAVADYTNLERRFSDQSASVIKFATASLLTKFLDVRDHLAMATTQIKDQGLNMILSSLDKILTEEGVSEVNTGGLYDPATMECQELVAGDRDQVIQVIRPGYRLHDRVLRPARVVVGSGASAPKGSDLQGSAQPEPKSTVREGQTL